MTINWWTLGIQTVNVAILVWLLGKFFWHPLTAMIEQRRATTASSLADLDTKRANATAALADIAQTRAGFIKEHDALLAAAQDAAKQTQAASLAEGEKKVADLQASAKAAIETDRQAAEKAWTERASHLAVEIAGRLAARLDGDAVRTSFRDWLINTLRALPAAARQKIAADDVTLDAVSAIELVAAEQEQCRALISAAVAGHPRVTFHTDPALIAGLELRGPELAISNSWAADLTTILADLTHDA